MSDYAPDFNEGYPSNGERIGPAWQATWDAMARKDWQRGVNLARAMAKRFELKEVTIRNLLRQATVAGLIEQEKRKEKRWGKTTTTAWYRRPQ